jgi:hypothetical protein
MGKKWLRWAFIILVLLTLSVAIWSEFRYSFYDQWSLTEVAEVAKQGRIQRIVVTGAEILEVTLTDGKLVISSKDPSSTAIDQLATLGVTQNQLRQIQWEGNSGNRSSSLANVLLSIPMFLCGGGVIYLILSGRIKIQRHPSLESQIQKSDERAE